MPKLEYSEVIQILDAEIIWCKNNSMNFPLLNIKKGFIKGLMQAKLLITALKQFNEDLAKESVYVKRD